MKNAVFVILLFAICKTGMAQKIISDKKHPVSGKRVISTNEVSVVDIGGLAILQARGTRIITKDSADTYVISFITPEAGVHIVRHDTSSFFCKIKIPGGAIYQGKWVGSSKMNISHDIYNLSLYTLTQEQAQMIMGSSTSEIDLEAAYDGGTYMLDKKSEITAIPKILKALVSVK
ncbi:MAG: hypothetical protein ABI687_11305 [Flavitalea sp.]